MIVKLSIYFLLIFSLTSEIFAQFTAQQQQMRQLKLNGIRFTPIGGHSRGGDPEQDCNSALAVCQNTFVQPTSYSGEGTIQEVPISSCLASQELNSVWYIFTVQTSGTLEFVIDPNDNNDDYDFALYNLTNANCSDIITGAAPEVRCNYCLTPGNTGLSSAGTNASEPASNCNEFSSILNVQAGQTYTLTVSNYSSSQSGYTLNFSGSANIFDNSAPSAVDATTPCNANFLTLQMSEAILCSGISSDGSEFTITGPGGPFTVTGALGINCGNATSQITVNFSPPVIIGSNYTLVINNGSDGNTLVDNCGNAIPPGSSLNFVATPPPGTITGPNTVCEGSPVTLTASLGTGYQWSTGASTQSITETPTTNSTYNVTITNGTCTQTATHSITLEDSPTAGFTYSPNPVCAGQSVQFTNTSISLGTCLLTGTPCTSDNDCSGLFNICFPGIPSYTWDFGDGSLDFLSTNPSHTYNTAGTYNVSLTISDLTGGCSNKIVVPITVLGTGNVITVSNDTTVCLSSPVTLTASGGASYSWTSNPAGFTSTDASITVTPAVTTIYTVSSPGCNSTSTASATITVNNTTLTIIPSVSSICFGESTSLTASGADTYTWSPADGLNTTTGANVIATPAASITYTVTGSNANGCTAINTAEVNVFPDQSQSIIPNGPTTFCPGDIVDLDAGAGFQTYSWSNGEVTQVITVDQAGTYDVTVADNNGCVYVFTPINITISNNLSPSILPIGPITLCPGSSVNLDAGVGYDTYTWSNGETTQIITVDQADTYDASVTNGNGCSGVSAPVIVTVSTNLTPVITPNGPITLCPGSSVDLNAGAGYDTYSWSNGETTQSITVDQAGTYDVSVTDANGCSGISTQVDVVLSGNLTPVITPDGPTTFCPGGNVILNAEAGYTIYNWNNGETTESITVTQAGTYEVSVSDNNGCSGVSNSIDITIASSLNPAITPTGPVSLCQGSMIDLDAGVGYATYAWSTGENSELITVNQTGKYKVTVSDGAGCFGSDSIEVTVFPTILAEAGPDVSICSGETTSLSASGGTQYSWRPVNSLNNANIENPDATPTITTKYYVDVSDGNCSKTDSVLVTVHALPIVTISNDTTINAGEIVNLMATGGTNYNWSPSTGLSSSSIANPSASPSTTTKYTVLVQDANGCTTEENVTIHVITDNTLIIPTAFSPNGDNINDRLNVVTGTGLYSIDLKIFNRWGEMVFHSEDKSIGWDGTYGDEPVGIGVYVYLLEAKFDDGSSTTKTGNITLVK